MGAYTFKMPDIGEGIVEAEVVAWHVAVGDVVAEDAAVADVMTDKATVEITSPVAGTVLSLGCAAGEKMVIGSSFVEFEITAVGSNSAATQHDTAPQHDNTAPAPVNEPENQPEEPATPASETIDGDVATADVADAPVETSSKPKIRVVSDGDAGVARVAPVASEKSVAVSEVRQDSAREAAADTRAKKNRDGKNGKSKIVDISPRREIVGASPAVRRLARDLGIDLASVRGSGPAGRVTNDDIRALLKSPQPAPATPSGSSTDLATKGATATATQSAKTAASSVTRSTTAEHSKADNIESGNAGAQRNNGVTELPVIGLRRLIAERMQTAKQRIPHFSYVEEVRVDQLEELRQHMNSTREEHQPKLSILHFILLAVAREVVNWPQCNAHFDDENSSLQQHSRVHLGVATMTSNGLMVPVVANACQLDIWEIAAEVNRLAESARNGSLAREELTGSTITVTSLGPLAGITTTPVINRPETSIIGPNKIMQKVVWESGAAVPVSVMNISSSFDHRVVDGYDAACFIQAVRTLLEKPALIFI